MKLGAFDGPNGDLATYFIVRFGSEKSMFMDTPSSRDILAAFIADVGAGKHVADSELAAILLEHLLLQGGFKIVSRQADDGMLIAASRATTPEDIWAEMWEAANSADSDENTGYVPA
jgi:hypothetical protein